MFALCLSIAMHFRSALSPKVDTAMDTHLLYEAPKSPTKTQSLAAARCNCRQKRWLYQRKLKQLFPATAHLPSGSGASLLEVPAPGDPQCCGTRPLLSPASPHRVQLTASAPEHKDLLQPPLSEHLRIPDAQLKAV